MDIGLVRYSRTAMTEISIRALELVVEQLVSLMQGAFVCEQKDNKTDVDVGPDKNSIHFFLPLLFPLPPLLPAAAASLVALVSPVAAASFCFRSKSLATSAFTMS